MNDKDVTIRAKIEVPPESASAVTKLTNQIKNERKNLANIDKLYAQAAAAKKQDVDRLEQLEFGRGQSRTRILRLQGFRTIEEAQSLANARAKIAEAAAATQAKIDAKLLAQRVKADGMWLESAVKMEAARVKAAEKSAAAQVRLSQQAARQANEVSGGAGNSLSGFGGKMIIGMAAGRAAGDIMGDRHGGQEIGSLISGFMFGGPAIGAAIGAMELVGQGFAAVRQNAKEAAKAAQEFVNTMHDVSKEWSELGTSLIEHDPFGKAMEKTADRARETARKIDQQIWDSIDAGPGFMEGAAAAITGKQTGWQANIDALNSIKAIQDEVETDAVKYEAAQDAVHSAAQARTYAAEEKMASLRSLASGDLKTQYELTARIAIEEEKRADANQYAMAQATAAEAESAKIAEKMNALADNLPPGLADAGQIKIIMDAMAATHLHEAAVAALAALGPQQAAADAFAKALAGEDQKAITAERGREEQKEEVKLQEAQVKATLHGYQEKTALREIAFAQEEKSVNDRLKALNSIYGPGYTKEQILLKEHLQKMHDLAEKRHALDREADDKAERERVEREMRGTMSSTKYQSGYVDFRALAGGQIPHYASGTEDHPGGPALVGEHGPEVLNLPAGSKVTPLSAHQRAVQRLQDSLAQMGSYSQIAQINAAAGGMSHLPPWVLAGEQRLLDYDSSGQIGYRTLTGQTPAQVEAGRMRAGDTLRYYEHRKAQKARDDAAWEKIKQQRALANVPLDSHGRFTSGGTTRNSAGFEHGGEPKIFANEWIKGLGQAGDAKFSKQMVHGRWDSDRKKWLTPNQVANLQNESSITVSGAGAASHRETAAGVQVSMKTDRADAKTYRKRNEAQGLIETSPGVWVPKDASDRIGKAEAARAASKGRHQVSDEDFFGDKHSLDWKRKHPAVATPTHESDHDRWRRVNHLAPLHTATSPGDIRHAGELPSRGGAAGGDEIEKQILACLQRIEQNGGLK